MYKTLLEIQTDHSMLPRRPDLVLINKKKKRIYLVCLVWLVEFYGISTIVGYLMPNPLHTYILNIYDLVWLGFMEYQPLLVI